MKGKQDMKKNIMLVLSVALLLVSCEDKFLDRKPHGGTIRQDQYENIDEKVEGTVRGLYTRLYTMSGGHDEFGKRSIDLWGDILSGDIAVTNPNYGWLVSDEQMQTVSTRTGAIWGFYYGTIHSANLAIKECFQNDSLLVYLEEGLPSENEEHEYTDEEAERALYYAQVLAIRGYCYAQLAKWYTPVEGCSYIKDKTIATYECCPIYTESNMDAPQRLATSDSVYNQAFSDLEYAVQLYREFDAEYLRPNKLFFDRATICGLLAQAYLNQAVYSQPEDIQREHLQKAHDLAVEAIEQSGCQILAYKDLLTTGFNNVDNKSWMWAQQVTVETSGGLKSWFGQVDIHSYSYAWAGATKAIDQKLYDEMDKEEMAWDGRYHWFRSTKEYNLCPDGKFFSEKNPVSTNTDDIDREWLSDNVFMRIEAMYLTASEAAFRMGQTEEAYNRLKAILDERANKEDFGSEYETYLSNIQNGGDALKNAIIYNWRVELWGEGYGLETFRRWNIENRFRGGNHYYKYGRSLAAKEDRFNMNIPSGEATYNPYVDEKED